MNVIVDTCSWSVALRRNIAPEMISVVNQLQELITEGKVILLGAIRQEFVTMNNLFVYGIIFVLLVI